MNRRGKQQKTEAVRGVQREEDSLGCGGKPGNTTFFPRCVPSCKCVVHMAHIVACWGNIFGWSEVRWDQFRLIRGMALLASLQERRGWGVDCDTCTLDSCVHAPHTHIHARMLAACDIKDHLTIQFMPSIVSTSARWAASLTVVLYSLCYLCFLVSVVWFECSSTKQTGYSGQFVVYLLHPKSVWPAFWRPDFRV